MYALKIFNYNLFNWRNDAVKSTLSLVMHYARQNTKSLDRRLIKFFWEVIILSYGLMFEKA